MTVFINVVKTLSSIKDGSFCSNSYRLKVFLQKVLSQILDRFLITPKGFLALYLTLEYLKYCLNTSKAHRKLCQYLKVSFFIKNLSNQPFGNSSFPINTTLETIKPEFLCLIFEIIKTSFYPPFIYFSEMQISMWLLFIE